MVQVKSDLDVAKANLESSKYFTKQQAALLDQEKDALSKCTITTPIDGTITALNAEIGEIVMTGTMNNPGTVIMNVSDLSTIEVQVDVDETDVARVKLGQSAKISIDAFQDTTFKGIVTEVGNSAKLAGTSTDRSTNFEVKILLQDTIPGIKPGMTATADIVTDRRKDVLYVPISAVVMRPDEKDTTKTGKANAKEGESSGGVIAATIDSTTGNKKDDKKEVKEFDGVFKVVSGQAVFVKVKTGISDQQHIQIVDGLTSDDEVITGSYKTLRTIKNKAKIKVVKDLPKEENK
jgi:HlyD family secretion protein